LRQVQGKCSHFYFYVLDPQSWQRLRKAVADLHRRAELSQSSNERYLDALAAVEHDQTLADPLRSFCQPTEYRGRRVRALQPLSEDDGVLLAAVIRGAFAIHGFRNRDLRPLLFGTDEPSSAEAKRQTSKITRLLRMLRARGILQKIPKTHRYTVTQAGREAIVALQTAKQASTKTLSSIAA